MRVRKPIARMTPICWRRSTTARALMTPSAATPDEEPEAQEALDQAVEGEVRGDGVVDDLLDRLGLEPAREEGGLEPGCRVLGVDAGSEPEVVDRRPDAAGERSDERLLRRRDADHLERRRVLEDADDGQADARLPVCLSRTSTGIGSKPFLEVEAGEPEVRAARRSSSCRGAGRSCCRRRRGPVAPDARPRPPAPSRSRARRRRGRTSCARGTASSSPRTRYVSNGRPAPTCFASTASTDWLPTAVKSRRRRRACAGAPGHVVDRCGAGRPGAHLEPAAEVLDADGVDERAVRRGARHEREDDEREHRERRAGAEACGERIGDRHAQHRRERADAAERPHDEPEQRRRRCRR